MIIILFGILGIGLLAALVKAASKYPDRRRYEDTYYVPPNSDASAFAALDSGCSSPDYSSFACGDAVGDGGSCSGGDGGGSSGGDGGSC